VSSSGAIDQLRELGGWLVGGGVTLAGAVALLRRQLSRDRLAATRDRAESTFTEDLAAERTEAVRLARLAIDERGTLLAANARLQALSEHQARELERLGREFSSWRRLVLRHDPRAAEFLPSSLAGLDRSRP
jgi:hypothetical protein